MMTVQQLSACLPVFPLRVGFCCSLCYFIIKRTFSCVWVLAFISPVIPWQNGLAIWGLSGELASKDGESLQYPSGRREDEDYARHFWESLAGRWRRRPASWSSSGEAWPSLSNPGCLTGFQRSPLDDYINLALNLSGSAFRQELAAEARYSLGAHRVRSRARSVPGAHRVHSRARSVPGAHRVPLQSPLCSGSPQSPLQSSLVPGAHRVHSRARSVPGAHRVRSKARFVPGAHRVHSRARLCSGSPQSPLQSPLCSGSPQSPLQSSLRSGSPQSPLQSSLRSRSPQRDADRVERKGRANALFVVMVRHAVIEPTWAC